MPTFDDVTDTIEGGAPPPDGEPWPAARANVRDGWVAARLGFVDNMFELRPETDLVQRSRPPLAFV